MACRISKKLLGFDDTDRVIRVLTKYGLPTYMDVDTKSIFHLLKMDKKKDSLHMHYILLKSIGEAVVTKIALEDLGQIIDECR